MREQESRFNPDNQDPDNQEQTQDPKDALAKAEGLTSQMGNIRQQVEDAQRAKEEGIKTRADKIEAIYPQTAEVQQQIEKLKENLLYFQQNKGTLDEAGRKAMEQTQTTLTALEVQMSELNQTADQLYSAPEVQDELHRRAKEEMSDMEIIKVIDEAEKKYMPQVERLARDLESKADAKWRNYDNLESSRKKYDQLSKKLWESIKGEVKEKHYLEIERVFQEEVNRDYSRFKEIIQEKAGRFGQAGAFSKVREFIGDINQLINEEKELKTYYKQEAVYKEELGGLPDQFMKILEEIDSKLQSRLNKLGSKQDIISSFSYRLGKLVREAAEKIWARKKHKDPSQVERSDYNGWYELNNADPRNRTMYDVQDEISKKAGEFIYSKERQQGLNR